MSCDTSANPLPLPRSSAMWWHCVVLLPPPPGPPRMSVLFECPCPTKIKKKTSIGFFSLGQLRPFRSSFETELDFSQGYNCWWFIPHHVSIVIHSFQHYILANLYAQCLNNKTCEYLALESTFYEQNPKIKIIFMFKKNNKIWWYLYYTVKIKKFSYSNPEERRSNQERKL